MSAPLSPEQRAAMTAALAYTEPASGEQVRRALSDALSVTGHNHQSTILERLRNAQGAVPAIVRRLLDAEARVAELEQQLASANESADSAAQALRVRPAPRPRRFEGVPDAVLEAALRSFVASHLDYDMHKYIEAPEDGSPDRYPELARELAKALALEAAAAGFEVEPW